MATKRYRVLVVEDYRDARELLCEYLRFRGFDVLEAVDGAEAIMIAKAAQPDVVLMDLRLPNVDGWEATRALRHDPPTRELMIVAVTAHALTAEMQSAIDAGCDAVVAKPYDLAALAQAITNACERGAAAFSVPGVALTPERPRKPKRRPLATVKARRLKRTS